MKYSDKINFVNRDDKKLLGGIQMNTKTFEQFDVMTDVELAKVEGGNKCVNAIFGGALTGAGSGFVGGMATLGVTSIPGAFVGAHFGAIAGGLYCVGASL